MRLPPGAGRMETENGWLMEAFTQASLLHANAFSGDGAAAAQKHLAAVSEP